MRVDGVPATPLIQRRAEEAYMRKVSAEEVRRAQILTDNMDKVTISEEARQRVLEEANKDNKNIAADLEKQPDKNKR